MQNSLVTIWKKKKKIKGGGGRKAIKVKSEISVLKITI